MRTINVSGKEVAVVSTASEWELYTASMNCTKAATALNAAVDRCVKAIVRDADKGRDIGKRTLLALYRKHLEPTMSRYDEFGAADSEPEYTACNTLRKIASAATNCMVDFSRGDT